jgi:nicotinate-nucleotide adenylyltransferase
MTEPVSPITPMPLVMSGPDRPELVVAFGGTFDPPHKGHVELPVRVRDEMERRYGCVGKAWLVYIPAARSPHKERGPVVSDGDRVEMLRLALAGVPRTGVWTDEIDRARSEEQAGEPSFTVDTLHRACEWMDGQADSGGGASIVSVESESEAAVAKPSLVPLRLLIGADQAIGFHRWRGPREIVRIARPVVMVRGDVEDADGLVQRMRAARFWKRDELEAWREGMVVVGRLDVSATRVREALRSADEGEAARWLAAAVVRYIRERGLYR